MSKEAQELEKLVENIPSIEAIREAVTSNIKHIVGRGRKIASQLFDAEIPSYTRIQDNQIRMLALYDRVIFDGKPEAKKMQRFAAGVCYRCSTRAEAFETQYERLLWNLANLSMGQMRPETLKPEAILREMRRLSPEDNEGFLYTLRNHFEYCTGAVKRTMVMEGIDTPETRAKNPWGVKRGILAMYELNVVYQFMAKLISDKLKARGEK